MAGRIVIVDGKPIEVPADATDAEISSVTGAIPAANADSAPKAKTWTDWAVDKLPAVGATAGAIVGGAGGTAFGLGFGGIPGAAGGAALGGGAGEAAKQLINRARGADAPESVGAAAKDIALEAAIDGTTTAALGGAGRAISKALPSRQAVAEGVQKLGKEIAKPHSVKRMVGKGIQMAGEAMEPTVTPPKITLDSMDVLRIRQLMSQGISQGDAVRTVLNLKVKALP